ncbi:hypothetical protein [Halorubrum amylolyticum]|uniref:hypothetical protein n=1 Tax=Halorubrum amylolyticum TaxID=2508724 RepID=UPI0010091801|nr:hypothetical protein [Halorubrum amylolyticum]
MSDDGPGAREVAHRVFATEFDDASLSYSESDEERAPNYVVTPTGARVNRLFVAGVLTEVERVNDETRRGRVVDPSGAFVTYAGQYQPEAQTFLERAEPPAFVALTGKARTFQPEDSDRVFTSVRPESLNAVDADTRDRWVVSAAEATFDRLAVFATALDSDLRGEELRAALESGGAPASLAAGIPKAIAHYDTSTAYVEALRRLAVDALELIAGDRDGVRALDIAPDAGGEAAIGSLPETDVTIEAPPEPVGDEATAESGSESAAPESDEPDSESESISEPESAVPDEGTAETTEAAETAETTEPESADADAIGSASTDAAPVESGPSGSESDEESGGLGDFDAGADDAEADESGIDDADPDSDEPSPDPDSDEMYQLDEEEREEIESEFGTDFSTGTEVDEPGEADIDVPDPEEIAEPSAGEGASASAEADAPADGGADATAAEPDAEEAAATGPEPESAEPADGEASEPAEDINLEAAVIDAMDALDDGDGAGREAVVEAVVDDHGVAADAVEDAIQDALMGGKCYEPGDGVLKPI